jgi:hypothetical protein
MGAPRKRLFILLVDRGARDADSGRDPSDATSARCARIRCVPPALIEALTKTLLATDGDLWRVSKALVAAPVSWLPSQAKIKHPSEGMVTSIRAAGFNNGDVRRQ